MFSGRPAPCSRNLRLRSGTGCWRSWKAVCPWKRTSLLPRRSRKKRRLRKESRRPPGAEQPFCLQKIQPMRKPCMPKPGESRQGQLSKMLRMEGKRRSRQTA